MRPHSWARPPDFPLPYLRIHTLYDKKEEIFVPSFFTEKTPVMVLGVSGGSHPGPSVSGKLTSRTFSFKDPGGSLATQNRGLIPGKDYTRRPLRGLRFIRIRGIVGNMLKCPRLKLK